MRARTGFPAGWDARLPATRRLLLPLAAGAGFGVLAIAVEEVTHSLRTLEGVLGPATVAFPASLLVYSAGAIKWELLFLLFPVPALLWLVSGVALRGRAQARTFWVLAALAAALEPLLQGVPLLLVSAGAIGPAAFAAYAVHGYAFNFAAGSASAGPACSPPSWCAWATMRSGTCSTATSSSAERAAAPAPAGPAGPPVPTLTARRALRPPPIRDP